MGLLVNAGAMADSWMADSWMDGAALHPTRHGKLQVEQRLRIKDSDTRENGKRVKSFPTGEWAESFSNMVLNLGIIKTKYTVEQNVDNT
jgi:hypothetical protein